MTNIKIPESVKRLIKDTREGGNTPIRFSIYDEKGKFLGYKADSGWTLHREIFKVHEFEGNIHKLHSAFLSLLNKDGYLPKSEYLNSEKKIYIVAEEIDENGKIIKGLDGIVISADKNNKYVIEQAA